MAKEDHRTRDLHRRETIAAFGREGLSDILVDSCAYVHVCPRYGRSGIDLGKADSDFSLQSVTGKQLNIYDRLIVSDTVDDDQWFLVNLSVT